MRGELVDDRPDALFESVDLGLDLVQPACQPRHLGVLALGPGPVLLLLGLRALSLEVHDLLSHADGGLHDRPWGSDNGPRACGGGRRACGGSHRAVPDTVEEVALLQVAISPHRVDDVLNGVLPQRPEVLPDARLQIARNGAVRDGVQP